MVAFFQLPETLDLQLHVFVSFLICFDSGMKEEKLE